MGTHQPNAALHDDTLLSASPDRTPSDVLKALRIDVDGQCEVIDLIHAEDGTCGALIRQALGCRRYTVIDVTDDIDMWSDDDGMPDLADVEEVNATLNPLATLLVADHRAIYQPYFGAALFTSRDAELTIGLTLEQLARLRAKADALAARPAQLAAFRQRITEAVTRQS